MLYELPSALADGLVDNKISGLSRNFIKMSIIQPALAKASEEFAFNSYLAKACLVF